MKIRKVTASFGKLQSDTLSFHEGLNIIETPHESGKTTWCAFIRAMLYGIDSPECAYTDCLTEKQKYAPRSGTPMEGSMDLTAENCDITITRTTKDQHYPMNEFAAVYSETGSPVENLTETNVGERLTGVSKDIFSRGAFVGQEAAEVTGSAELEKKISAILASGEENISYSDADRQLHTWLHKRRYNHQGYLPELEEEEEKTKYLLIDMESSTQQLAAKEEMIRTLETECDTLEQQVIAARKKQRETVLTDLHTQREEVRRLTEEQNQAFSETSEKRKALQGSTFGNQPMEQVEAKAETDIAALEELASKNSQQKTAVLPSVFCFILALAAAAVYQYALKSVYLIAAAILLVAVGAFFLLRFTKAIREERRNREMVAELLKKYGVADSEEIRSVLNEHRVLSVALQEAEKKEKAISEKLTQAEQRLAESEHGAVGQLDYSGGNTLVELGKKLSAKREELAKLRMECAREDGRIRALGAPAVLTGECRRLETKRKEIQAEYDAIQLTIDTLKAANVQMQVRISPELEKVTAQYMAQATDGKYNETKLSKDLAALVKAKDSTIPCSYENLSSETADLLYICVRLAVCELALPAGEPYPLILDDALENLNEEQLNQVMKILREIAKERQVILLTSKE